MRRGYSLRGHVGFGSCLRQRCTDPDAKVKVGPALSLGFGYRPLPRLVVLARADIQRMDLDLGLPGVKTANVTHATGGVELDVHPVARGRFDPYVGAGLGYSYYRERWDRDQENYDVPDLRERYRGRFHRAYASLQLGFDVFVLPQLAVGPQFRYVLPFGGRYCTTENDFRTLGDTSLRPAANGCGPIAQATISSERRRLPHPWSFTLGLTGYLG